jgi:1-acyl-sn-glycerol-3-phosphate acyltransferase
MISRLVATGTRLLTGVRRLPASPHGEGPAVFYANHSSHLDFVVVWSALPYEVRDKTSPAAAEDYWTKTRLRRWLACKVFQAVLIARQHITRENHPVDRLAACLQQGRSVLIFPEGTRRTDGEVGEFKSGLYHLAQRFPDVPLVPVHLENLHRVLPKGAFAFVPIIVQAHFHAPIRLQAGEGKNEFLQRARAALIEENTQL